MKRILIAGENSFLGKNVEAILKEKGYSVTTIDMQKDTWNSSSLAGYDAVINVCAIVHRPNESDELFFKVNRDLAYALAVKSKEDGVKQFVQISTNGVFGIELGIMSSESLFEPKSAYEISKYEADCLIEALRSPTFSVTIIRPPLIYGLGCKGNFPRIEHFAKKSIVFPKINNKKDFIYVKNLAHFILFVLEHNINGICYPRNSELISTWRLVKTIAKENNHKICLVHIFNPFIFLFMKFVRSLRLIFGTNYCSIPVCEQFEKWVEPYSFDDSIKDMYSNANSKK